MHVPYDGPTKSRSLIALELYLPDQIALDEASRMVMDDVMETARRVNEYRPLPPDVVRRIQDELVPERVHASNAIEGNTLEFRETKMILETGQLLPSKRREAMEARNLGQAVTMLADIRPDDSSIHTRERLLDVHRIVLREINDPWAGRFREHGVKITGASWKPPQSSLVPTLVDRVLERLAVRGDGPPLLMGVWAHWALAAIHPFHDGNGRMARLWQDLVFYQRGLTCAIIQAHDRREYFEAIQSADEGRFDPLVQFVARRMLTTFDRYLAELGKEKEAQEWVDDLVGEADARAEQIRQRQYMLFTRVMDRLRFEFTVYAAKISERSHELSVQVRDFPMIEPQAWENLIRGVRVERTWYFVIDLRRGTSALRYCFFFGKHYWSELDTPPERNSGVCLLISEFESAGAQATRLDEIENCPIAVRELFVADGQLVRRRLDLDRGESVYDRGIDSGVVARDFYHDVILHRLT